MSQLQDYRLLTFDVYGTLVDWEGGILAALQPALDRNGAQLSREHILHVFHELERDQQARTPEMQYSDLLSTVHPTLLQQLGLSAPTSEESKAFGDSVGHWPAFPDTVDALKRLSKHYKLVVLSNVDRASFAKTNAGSLQGFPFDLIITAQDIGSYKPDLNNFRHMLAAVQERFGIEPSQVLQTAQSQFHDHHPARTVGIKSVWIVRPGAIMGNLDETSFRLRLYQWLWRLRNLSTPLRLRGSLVRLRRFHESPLLALICLLIPFPSWKFPLPDPVAPIDIVGNVELEENKLEHLDDLRSIPLWRARDTPLRSLYRMYEAMISGMYEALGPETEYFWYQRNWSLQGIRDPRDTDPVRYAILACLVEELVVAFNWRLSLGLRRDCNHIMRETGKDSFPPYAPLSAPIWTSSVPAISPENLDLFPPEYVSDVSKLVLEADGLNKVFARRNIVTNVGWLYTI
ncbi:HAD-like domain-containing protein [Aspergillus bertholletiae]|uniref:HAD-like domain-containing protein n=1 Tax=Aspergillus bertholletiae TaxID=1226010 RepID=A0A5N7BIK0_9EURO|nr:HAD-like domain-containing protein [Aspergillus bertholletiae]